MHLVVRSRVEAYVRGVVGWDGMWGLWPTWEVAQKGKVPESGQGRAQKVILTRSSKSLLHHPNPLLHRCNPISHQCKRPLARGVQKTFGTLSSPLSGTFTFRASSRFAASQACGAKEKKGHSGGRGCWQEHEPTMDCASHCSNPLVTNNLFELTTLGLGPAACAGRGELCSEEFQKRQPWWSRRKCCNTPPICMAVRPPFVPLCLPGF